MSQCSVSVTFKVIQTE